MTTSEAINEIASALAKAQASMKNAALNKVNPHFKSKYADLAGIRDTVIPDLAKNGIAVVQTIDTRDGNLVMLTRLIHAGGQWIESLCPIPAGSDMQKMGSAITYARRYSLSAICGIAADEDDDANAAAAPQPAKAAAAPQPAKAASKPAGYDAWFALMDAFAAKHTDAELITEIAESGDESWKAYLRADTKALSDLRAKAAQNSKKKSAA
jgi:hypothetical protein